MGTAFEKFHQYLRSRGLKLTSERKNILKKVVSIHDHFDAEELLYMLKEDGKQISRASVYRTLNLLVDSNLVEKVDFGEGRAYYEHTLGNYHHDHLICVECGKVIQFEDQVIEKRQKDICKKHKFELDYHTLNIFGRCSECNNGRREEDASTS